ncbi:SGNH/GDSL hydrolase family protein [Myroides odoratimimus]|uniref:SGNH/GDSL hydrolase family protein n=1 Tax=Myroides odoratimimus TaxID=76832 RepID=UPI002576E605|nr:SGNH/GDSL hydrolase family protein [Myroides odoratimimus]MDM1513604.1 SGNH/GDSL hydrolase family protein [Myroides odoratimimus]
MIQPLKINKKVDNDAKLAQIIKENIPASEFMSADEVNSMVGKINEMVPAINVSNGGFQGVLEINEKRVDSGFYIPTESGTFINAGNVVVDLSQGINFVTYDGDKWDVAVVPIVADGKVEEGNAGFVSGGEVFDTIKESKIIFRKGYVDKEGKVILRNDVSFWVSDPIEINDFTILDYNGSVDAGSGVAQAVVTFDKEGKFIEVILGTLFNSKEGVISLRFKRNVKYVVASSLESYNKIRVRNSFVSPNNIHGILDYFSSVFNYIDVGEWEKGHIRVNGENAIDIYENWRRTLPVFTQLGDIFIYKGRTQADDKKPSEIPSIFCYDKNDIPLYPLLGNYLNEQDFIFRIDDPKIAYIKANAISFYQFNLRKVINNKDSILNTDASWAYIGDSITFVDDKNNFKGYPTFVRQNVLFTKTENRGYSGLGLVDDESRGSILSNIKNIDSFDFYSIFAGTNDFRLDHPIGEWNDYFKKKGSSTFYGALREVIDLLYNKNPKAIILLITPLRRDNSEYTSFSINNAGYTLTEIRDAIVKVANHEALPCIDFYNYSGITDRNLNLYTSDGLHPTEKGHQLISNNIINFFKSIAI